MKLIWAIIVSLAALTSGRSTTAKPAMVQANAESRHYEIGSTYKYDYETSTLMNDPQPTPVSSLKDVGFKVQVNVEVTPLWASARDATDQILQIRVTNPDLSVKARKGPAPEGFLKKNSRIQSYTEQPLFIHWRNGVIHQVFSVQEDNLSMINLKKGIASLLQYNAKTSNRKETDTSGECDVTYKVMEKNKILKTKENCVNIMDTHFYNSTNKVLGANIENSASVSYEFHPQDKIISSAMSSETHFLRIQSRLESGSEVMSSQRFTLKNTDRGTLVKHTGKNAKEAMTSIAQKLSKKVTEETLATKPDEKECISCKTLKDLINNFKKSLLGSNLGKQSSAIAFLRILHKMRSSDQDTIKNILSASQMAHILPQLLDIAAAAQTVESHKAVMSVLNFKDSDNIELPERYLLAVSLTTHPSDLVIQDLLKLLKGKIPNQKLRETLLLTVAAMGHTYSLSIGKNKAIVKEIGNYIQTKIEKCKKEECKLRFIRAMKNLREKRFLPELMKYIMGKDRKPAIYAMRALQTMPQDYIDEKICTQLEKVFFELDRPHDSTVRSLAANVLLKNHPSDEFLQKLFENLSLTKNKELNTLVLSQIYDIISTNPELNKKVKNVLRSKNLSNYHILGQNGLSTSFSRTLAKDQNSNSSFTNILEISGGLLKRSTVDVFVHSDDAKMNLLSFEIFAGGLNMFGGEEDEAADESEEKEEANAGIEITLMNTQLRPYVFFTGQGELMGHVWSGTGSERTTALQGSVLLQDHRQYVPLQNGFNIEMLLTGVISYDFAGQVEISLWNRNAHSLVEVAAAVVVQGQSRIDNSFVQTMIEFNSGTRSQLNFVSDLDFSDDIKMCMQMTQPDFDIVENVRKLERIPGSKYMLRKYKRKDIPVAGKTYVMNKKNTELCNKMFR